MLTTSAAAIGLALFLPTFALPNTADQQSNTNITIPQSTAPVTVDGSLTEFRGTAPLQFTVGNNAVSAYTLWTATALSIGFEVRDNDQRAVTTNRDSAVWLDDSVEWFVDTQNDKTGSMGSDDYHGIVNILNAVYDERGYESTWNGSWQSAVTRDSNGYTIEISIPWSTLGVAPAAHMLIGLGVAVNDHDSSGRSQVLYPATTNNFQRPLFWPTAVLQAKDVFGSTLPPIPAPPDSQFCHIYSSSTDIPDSYGAAYNVFSSTKELLLVASCTPEGVLITVGNGHENQYVYRYGYHWVNGRWQQLAFTGPAAAYGDWLLGKATTFLARTETALPSINYYLAYICTWTGTTWRCGCRDDVCTQHYWQLQAFRGGPSPDGTADDAAAGDAGSANDTPADRAPVIGNINVDAITSNRVDVEWTVAPASTGYVEYGTSTSYGNATVLESSHLPYHRQTLRGLLPGTTYHFRIHGRDAQGNKAVSQGQTFVTNSAGNTVVDGGNTTYADGRRTEVACTASDLSGNQVYTVGEAKVFENVKIALPSQYGTAEHVVCQGSLGSAYIRRPGKKATDVGKVDYYARGISGSDQFVVKTSQGRITVQAAVEDTVPPGAKTLQPGGDWKSAVQGLQSGDTLVVKAGVYNLPYDQAPTVSASNVTIMADPDDIAAGKEVIIWPGGSFLRPFYENPAGQWEKDPSAPSGAAVYRSKSTNIAAHPGNAGGMYRAPSGEWVRLFHYHNLNQLRNASTPASKAPKETYYYGPGFSISGGRLYIRLDPPPLGYLGRSTYPWPTYLADFFAQSAAEKDPNNRKVIIGYTKTGWQATPLLKLNGSNTTVKNLSFFGGGTQLILNSSGHRVFGSRFWAVARPEVEGESYHGTSFFVADNGQAVMDRNDFNPGAMPHISYNANKSHSDGKSSIGGASPASTRTMLYYHGKGANVTVRNSRIGAYFWWGAAGHTTSGKITFHHNLFHQGHYEGLMYSQKFRYITLIRNVMHQTKLFDYAYDGATTDYYNQNQMHHYIGYNLYVYDAPRLIINKYIYPEQYNPSHNNGRPYIGHSWNGSGRGLGNPRKYYYNTAVMRSGRTRGGTGFLSDDYQPSMAKGPNHNRWGVNNILVSLKHPEASSLYEGEVDHIGFYPHPTDGYHGKITTDVYDGNHYYKDEAMKYGLVSFSRQAPEYKDYEIAQTVADIRRISNNKWEMNGTGGIGSAHDPKFAGTLTYPFGYKIADYMLKPGSPAATGAIDVTGYDWDPEVGGPPDFDGTKKVKLLHQKHRGALDPDIPTIEQEIGPM